MLNIEGINIKFDKELIKDSNLKFDFSMITVICGESGSGKTSLLNMINEVNPHQMKSCFYLEKNLFDEKYNHQFIENEMFYIKQDYSFIEHLDCFSHIKLINQDVSCEELMTMVGLNIDRHTMPQSLSTGEKQKMMLALAIASHANVIICDELGSSLDEQSLTQMIKVLKYLAYEKHKMIILTTHNEQLMTIADKVYKIENRSLKVEVNNETQKINPAFNKRKNNLKNTINLQFNSFFQHFSSLNLYTMIVTLVVMICSISSVYSNQQTLTTNHMKSLMKNNTFYMVNQTNHSENARYNDNLNHFDNAFIETLKQDPTIDKLYPFFEFPMNKRYLDENGNKNDDLVNQYQITIIDDTERTITINEDNHRSFKTVPYYKEQGFEYNCVSQTYDNNGIYLNHDAAYVLGIDEVKPNMKLRFQVQVPIAITQANGIINDGIELTNVINTLYKTETIEMPIAGILDGYYIDFGGGCIFYAPYEKLTEMVNSQLGCSAFYAIVNENFEMSSKLAEYQQINSNFRIFNFVNYLNQLDYQKLNQEKMIKIAYHIVLVSSVILAMIYGLYLKKNVLNTNDSLKYYGFSLSYRRKYFIIEALLCLMITLLGSFVVTNLIYYILRYFNIIVTFYKYQSLYYQMLGIVLLFACLIPLITYLPSLLTLKKHND